MNYSKWLWDEILFVAYHMDQDVARVKTTLSPIERRYVVDWFISQREKENAAIEKQRKG